MAQAILLIGGNLGDRLKYLELAEELISERIGPIELKSPIYESEPWGFNHQQNFLNRALSVRAMRSPLEVLDAIGGIENDLGRVRLGNGYSARTQDIDIIFYDQHVMLTPRLTIPHKLLHERLFVLKPLADIIPDFIHPLFGVTVNELLAVCPDRSSAWLYQPQKKKAE
ncbi:MAG: 2-amino-4-hydroxy-6-hydroxymethyldihydropteridine diphosphokinase [Bacteroidales bacterium]|nr:2-amino-4-hydroxy-6-hydroxymethyldihydropteridine diphosphokinase [Bacteroidales bacterium]MBN2750962.1 2-amino-4-hydroxy-6-hydroxymethyldihydropteridine diphosphokinase [Bacteroidales bacterium]